MSHIWSIARKELRGYFNSAIALIFLFTFLLVVMFTFFSVDKFLARNIADVRPLFEWLPLLLIFLVAALTMRLWSEEQRTGTLELLLTLPVPIHRLVLGKFVAGLILVAIALALTLGLPITVEVMGDLDWGPVIGGYLAALLLASVYLALGLCVSSTTDNQIVALLVTLLLCGLLYAPGTEQIAGQASGDTGEILRLIGTGSRFDRIARGMLDLRDLVYYGGWVALLLLLNTALLQAKRWSRGARTRPARLATILTIALVALNGVAINIWLTPVTAARADLTQDNVHKLSAPTKKLIRSLDEPLLIRGYFSQNTHPKLRPLIPEIRDRLSEYAVIGGDKVRVEIIDPGGDEKLEEEAKEQYNIKSVAIPFADRHAQSIVNAYFHVLIAYGDQHAVLSLNELIEVESADIGELTVKLGNLEYDVTKTIRKVAYGFQSMEALFSSLPGKVEILSFVTPETLPANVRDAPAWVTTIVGELEEKAGGKLTMTQVVPKTVEEQRSLLDEYGLEPYLVSLFSDQVFYLHFVVRLGDRMVRVPLPDELTEASLRQAFEDSVRRVAPGFIKVVGLVTPPTPPAEPPQFQGMPPQQPRPPQSFGELRRVLSQNYEVRPVTLEAGPVGDDIDVLILAGPEGLGGDDKALRAIDQYLMRGGAVIALVGRHRLDLTGMELSLESVDSGLTALLDTYGVKIGDRLVLDEQSDSSLVPLPGGDKVFRVPDYPFFVRVDRDGMRDRGAMTRGLGSVVVSWATALTVNDPKQPSAGDDEPAGGAAPAPEIIEILRSSKQSWLATSAAIGPDFVKHPRTGYGAPSTIAEGDGGSRLLAVALRGSFDSAFRDKATPKSAGGDGGPPAERIIKRSPPNTRLVVVGTSSLVEDVAISLSAQSRSRHIENNLLFLHNLVDWAVDDADILALRARGGRTRPLEVEEDDRGKWEIYNYVIALFGLLLVIGVSRLRGSAHLIVGPTAPAIGGGAAAAKAKADKAMGAAKAKAAAKANTNADASTEEESK